MGVNINMNILPIDSSNINFKTCARRYSPKNIKQQGIFGESIIRTSTNIFREDIDWLEFTDFIVHHFLPKANVNIHSLACSDGSEPYSLAICFLKKIPKTGLNKYLPIEASDIDSEMIKTAKSGRLNLADFELDYYDNSKFIMRDFFKQQSDALVIDNDKLGINPTHSYEPISELKKSVKFHVGDMLGELNNLKDEGNSVIMCRNVFPYLSKTYSDNILQTLDNKLKSGSIVVTGSFDERADIINRMLSFNFFNPINGSPNIFQKK